MSDLERAADVARAWLKRVDLNPKGELALVAREFVRLYDERSVVETDAVAYEPLELPPFPFHTQA